MCYIPYIYYIVLQYQIYTFMWILIGWEIFDKNWYHPLNHENTPYHVMELDNGWYRLTTGDIPKKYRLRRIYARTVHHRFWLASYERLNYGVRNTNSNIHLTWIVLKPNVLKMMYLINIQYNILIIDCTRG